MSVLGSKMNSLAKEKMKAIEDKQRKEKMNTKQRPGTPTRDMALQQHVMSWFMHTLNEMPSIRQDYDHWLQDGSILVRMMHMCMFNSVPMEHVSPELQTLSSREERVKLLRKYLRKYGVAEEYIFEEEDLTEFKNIPKVTRCFAMLAKMMGHPVRVFSTSKQHLLGTATFQNGVAAFQDLDVAIPSDDEVATNGQDSD